MALLLCAERGRLPGGTPHIPASAAQDKMTLPRQHRPPLPRACSREARRRGRTRVHGGRHAVARLEAGGARRAGRVLLALQGVQRALKALAGHLRPAPRPYQSRAAPAQAPRERRAAGRSFRRAAAQQPRTLAAFLMSVNR